MNHQQCRMARAALDWSIQKLSFETSVSRNTVTKLESGVEVRPSIIVAIQKTFESNGIIFISENGEGPGVRLKKHSD